ncbi:hypothetical protein EZS27_014343 [termite gut metagenome]|uniref:Uncharacterized protein n=1 Tax=termite gut metagenome TaxID=433724 RepID=A0A5J4RVK5_9ZZZZ
MTQESTKLEKVEPEGISKIVITSLSFNIL